MSREKSREKHPHKSNSDSPQTVTLEITGELDLHTFNPKDLGSLVPEYLKACKDTGIKTVRIVHGKGTGTLRRSVHSILKDLDMVDSFKIAGLHQGHWGATLVFLK